MAGKLQGITLEIGGDTKKLNDALKDTNNQIYSTQNELKQVEKLLKLDPKNTELLAQKQELLGKEISATKDKLDKLKEAQKQANESGLTSTEDGQKAYRELQREIIATENSLKNFQKQQDEASNKFDLLGEKAGKFNKVMAGLGASVIGAGVGLVKMGIDAGATADEILTLSAQTGLSTDAIQEFKYMQELVDVPMETMTKSLAKLTKNMASAQGGSKSTSEAFAKLGVSVTDANGELRNNQDVFDDVIAKLGEMENETERDAISMQIFGKSAQDLNPLILAGADSIEEFRNQAHEMGAVLDGDALASLGNVDDKVQELKAQFSATITQLGANLSTILVPVMEKVQDLLKWVMDNGDTLVVILGAIASTILTFNAVTMIQGMIKAFKSWQVATEGLSTAQALLNVVMNANPIGIVISLIAGVVTAITLLWNKCDWFRNGVTAIFDWLVNAFQGLFDFLFPHFDETMAMIKQVYDFIAPYVEIVQQWISEKITGAISGFIDFFKAQWELMVQFVQDPIGTIKEIFASLLPQIYEWAKSLVGKVKDGFSKISEVGENLVRGLFNGIKNSTQWLWSKLTGWVDDVMDFIKGLFGINSPSKVMRDEVGKYLAQGIGVGFEKEMPSVIDDITKSCQGVADAIRTDLDINAMPNINKQITSQNYYTTKSYQNTTEIVRQPSEVIMQIDKTQFGRVVVPAYNQQMKIVGANLK